jgi:formamidopyrimidine-DNA glycosylase
LPEGAELAVSRDSLKSLVEGKAIVNIFPGKQGRYSRNPPTGFNTFLALMAKKGSPRIKEVAVKGKFMHWTIAFPCDSENWHLWTTYGMTGMWQRFETKHTAFGLYYNDSGIPIGPFEPLYFNDQRRFGTLKFVRGEELHVKKLASLGPDLLNGPLPSVEEFRQILMKKPVRPICEILLDQSAVSGVGNYVRAEALYRAGVDPFASPASLSHSEVVKVLDESKDVLRESYKAKGATLRDYRTADGSSGGAQFILRVYGRKTCPMGHPVSKRNDSTGRAVHYCPTCQVHSLPHRS